MNVFNWILDKTTIPNRWVPVKSDPNGVQEVYDPKVFNSLVAYEGTATADGPDTSTITDTVLATKPDFNGQLVIITSGSYQGQARDIDQATDAGGGKVHVATAFGGIITSGTTYMILSIIPTTAEVAKIETKCDAIKTQTDKLAGQTPSSDSVTKNWNTGTGTSGEAGGDLVSLGADNTRYKLHSLLVNISAVTGGATITVKLFTQVNGTQRKVYSQAFVKGTDPDGLWIVNGTVGIHEVLRVEIHSTANESAAIEYDYMLEVM